MASNYVRDKIRAALREEVSRMLGSSQTEREVSEGISPSTSLVNLRPSDRTLSFRRILWTVRRGSSGAPKYSPFTYLVILTTFCAQFGLPWRCVPFYQLPVQPLSFLCLRAVPGIILLLPSRNSCWFFDRVFNVLGFLTVLSLEAIPSIEEELRGPFVLVFQTNLFRFMVIGRLTPTKFILIFPRMLSCATRSVW